MSIRAAAVVAHVASACRIALDPHEYVSRLHDQQQEQLSPHLAPKTRRTGDQCSAFVFWHIESTGGRSICSLMTSYIKERYLLCAKTASQQDYVRHLKNRSWVASNRHLFVEHHLHKFGGGWLASYNGARPTYAALGCKLVIGTMLREPISLFWSWYRHFGNRAIPFETQARGKAEMLLWSWGLGSSLSKPNVQRRVLQRARSALAKLDWIGLHSRWDESIVLLLDLLGLPLPVVRPHVGGAPPEDHTYAHGPAATGAPPPPLVADFDCTWTNGCCMRYPRAPHCVATAHEQQVRAGLWPPSAISTSATSQLINGENASVREQQERALLSRLNAASAKYYRIAAELFEARLSLKAADPSFAARVAGFRELPLSNQMFGFQEKLRTRDGPPEFGQTRRKRGPPRRSAHRQLARSRTAHVRTGLPQGRPMVVLIVGASRGIGLSLARLYASTANVTLHATARDLAAAASLLALPSKCHQTSRVVLHDRVNVCDAEHRRKLIESLRDSPLDVVIYNAGINRGDAPTQLVVNAEAPMALLPLLLPGLLRGYRRVICLITSSMGTDAQLEIRSRKGDARLLNYSLSKLEANRRFRSVEPTWRAQGITAVALNPGFVATDMNGGKGKISATTSARGIARVLAGSPRPLVSGSFVDYQGHVLSWSTGRPLRVSNRS